MRFQNNSFRAPGRAMLAWTVAGVTLALFAATGNAAVISVDNVAWVSQNSSSVTLDFDASGSDKLVVIVTGEHGNPGNAGGNCTGITYDGVALTQAVNRDPIASPLDQTYNDIWYLDNPATSGGSIVASTVTRGSLTAFALSGTAVGVGATAIGPRDSKHVDLTTTAPNSIVIASHGMGGDGNTADVQNVDAVAPLIETSATKNGGGRSWDGHVTGYAQVPTAGPGTYSFTGGNTTGSHVIAAEFLADSWLKGELGILDVSGTNPATGEPWKYGDKYHLTYVTTTTTDALSTDIADYNAFVQADADAEGMGAVDWFALGSTTSTNAIDNAVITGPVINISNNAAVATDEADMWDFLFPEDILDLSGDPKNVWTGTAPGGVGDTNDQLGAANGSTRRHWSAWDNWGPANANQTNSDALPMVAISQELMVVPEPSSALLVLLGLVGLLMVRRKR